jgi:Putative zinc-finger
MTTNAGSRPWDCSEARVALGVYVLGAIDPAERVLLEAHLATCEACQAELAELADLPALLALVPAEEAIALAEGLPGDHLFAADDMLLGPLPDLNLPSMPVDPAPVISVAVDGHGTQGGVGAWGTGEAVATGGLPGAVAASTGPREAFAPVIDLADRRRRRLARVAAVAAAAVIVGAASFGGAKLAAGPGPGSSADAQHPKGVPLGTWQTAHGANGPAAAAVSYRSMGWGVQLDAEVTGIPPATPCEMWVVESNGQRAYAGSWITDSDEGAVWYPGSAATTREDIKAFVITISGGRQITVTPA